MDKCQDQRNKVKGFHVSNEINEDKSKVGDKIKCLGDEVHAQ